MPGVVMQRLTWEVLKTILFPTNLSLKISFFRSLIHHIHPLVNVTLSTEKGLALLHSIIKKTIKHTIIMKQQLNEMQAFLKTGCTITSIASLCIYIFLRIILWGMPFDLSEEFSIPVKSVLCGNTVFVVFVFSFLLLERSVLYIGSVVVPELLLFLKQQPEIGTAKKASESLSNTYSIRNTIVYDEVVLEDI